jgi:uncharacterized protein YjbI with pentapeptide repeats
MPEKETLRKEAAMETLLQITQRLRHPDNELVLRSVEALRTHGWLENGALEGLNLQYVHLQQANLAMADLQKVNLSMADLRWANLSGANLGGAQLNNANLYRADMGMANLQGANLIKANLQGTRNLSAEQLTQVNRLRGATMPDGSLYDGRFNLSGDIECARGRRVNLNDPKAMAAFYGVFSHIPPDNSQVQSTRLSGNTDMQLIRKLRSSDNSLVVRAAEELRRRGRLSDGTLAWVQLRYAHLQGADLGGADLRKASLSLADLRGANLSYACLQEARLDKANLSGAEMDKADLRNSLMTRANLQGAHSLSVEQLAQASRLRGATLPDGRRYDGRFNLPGDSADARFLGVDHSNLESLADFYGVCMDDYTVGQQWALENRSVTRDLSENISRVDIDAILARLYELENGRYLLI